MKKLKYDGLRERLDGATWDDQELCEFIVREADPADPDNMEIMSRADDMLNALARLEEILAELEIERG